MHTIEGSIYAALSECFKEPSEEFAEDIASGRLEEVMQEGLRQLCIPVPSERFRSLRLCHPELVSGSQMMQGQEIPKQVQDDSNNDRESVFSGEIISVYQKLKADYHSLFFPLYVVPVESVYKEWSTTDDVTGGMKGEKGFIMGDPAVEMINRYRMAGIEIPQTYKDIPDHIAILLEYASLLCENIKREDRASFVSGHLDWVTELHNDIYKYSESNFYRAVADITVAFIQYERANLMTINQVGIAHPTSIS